MTARVLVVDDILPNVKLLEAKLSNEYFDVITATSGAEALEKAQAHGPDIVLLDVMMPGMDGFETCQRLKSNPATAHIPVVMVTALTDATDRVRAAFANGRAHMIGTSGTVTSLAGVHLDLPRYERSKVDGYWFDVRDCRAVLARLLAQSPAQRAQNPCIGKDRADLVVAGGAILDAVLRVWPVERIRVADRGLREGVLMRLMAEHGALT